MATAMDMLLVLGAFDEEVQREGHVYAHAIGINAFQSDPDVAKTFARCTELFQSGCYHGVIQAYLDQELGPSLADDSGPSMICVNSIARNRPAGGYCSSACMRLVMGS